MKRTKRFLLLIAMLSAIAITAGCGGSLDTAFDGDGIVVHNNAAGGNSSDIGSSITTDSADRILVAGYSSNASGNYDMVIWRYMP